jgi:hypothetical protein
LIIGCSVDWLLPSFSFFSSLSLLPLFTDRRSMAQEYLSWRVECSRAWQECSRRSPSELFRGTVLARTSLSISLCHPDILGFVVDSPGSVRNFRKDPRISLRLECFLDHCRFGMGSFESSMAESSWFRSLTRSSESVVVGDYKTRGSERFKESSTRTSERNILKK